jgi:hypothetical protein
MSGVVGCPSLDEFNVGLDCYDLFRMARTRSWTEQR